MDEDTSVAYQVMRDCANSLIAAVLNNSHDRGGKLSDDEAMSLMKSIRKRSRSVPTRDMTEILKMTDIFCEEKALYPARQK